MAWTIEFDEKADKQLKKLPRDAQKQITRFLLEKSLTHNNPRSFGKPLQFDKIGMWRYRVGKYRIICEIKDDKLIVLVLKVDKRDKVYN